jgi:hypothetical protein
LLTFSVNTVAEFKIDQDFAQHFAQDWIESWNNHDLERVLTHYADDFGMSLPNIIRRSLSDTGKLVGKEAMRGYWWPPIGPGSTVKMTLIDTLLSTDSLTLYYRLQNDRVAAEVFFFNDAGLAYKSAAYYSLSTQPGS